ncbi:MAG: secretion system protein [Peptococcaceae bacterium BICA1-7]|nr:MAG: secretion system protein [Peptococcaceae bacterium BICA1-7]HBV97070.1 type II secretion system F family protein [Desulfotomaculum sp.]
MPVYSYQAIEKSGALTSGQLEADNEPAAIGKLRGQGLTLLEIGEVRSSPLKNLLRLRRGVKLGELCLFSRQLASMLDAGIPLTRALFTLSRQSDNPTLRDALDNVARSIEGGMGFSDALKGYPGIFNDLYINMIQAGEVGGTLEEILKQLSEQLEKEKNLRDQIRTASVYPLTILVFAFLVILMMLIFVVPAFEKMLPGTVKLPLPTRIVFGASASIREWWFLYVLAAAGTALGSRQYLRSPAGSRAWEMARFRIPVFGPLFHKAVVARFCRILSTLLSGGIPILQALDSAGPAAGSKQVEDAVESTIERIQEGRSIAGPLESSGMFPPMVIQMVAVGEESGTLAFLLGRVADFYEAEVASITKNLTSLIEPLMVIFVGTLVGGMVISIYLPIFTVVTQGR